MAVSKVDLLEPLTPVAVTVNPQALVIGGGVAGMVAALGLAKQGFPVHLIERSSQLGGNARHLYKTWKKESIQAYVDGLVAQIREHPFITVHMKGRITRAEGSVGNFKTTVEKPHCTSAIDHGVVIVAVGGQAHKPDEYAYGQSQRVFTALEFDKLHLVGDERIRYGRNFVFIQCVGSRTPDRPYCSRVCCTHSIQAAIDLKEEDAERNVFILYRDIRSFGQREELYARARELGVIFMNYEMHRKPLVRPGDNEVTVVAWDHVLHEAFKITADVVVLATAVVPQSDVRELARLYRLPVDADGFLQEAHGKLRPVDFSSDGLFLAGIAHYPKPIEEVISQAMAAVARAATVLANRRIPLDSVKAQADEAKCDGCALCLDVCPYDAITLEGTAGSEEGWHLRVSPVRCKGCGNCQATCPKDAINVGGFSIRQLKAQVDAALS
jgi:heterodisulfide reductase subunit A